MQLQILCAMLFYCIISSSSRLVVRVTDKPDASSEDVKDVADSKEDKDGPEIVHFYTGKVRKSRQPDEQNEIKNVTKPEESERKSKPVLVKKPIPKYKELDSDEDYQNKKWHSKLVDSVEHEDEDFSLNDYEFDVNHDEFASRGKLLEPRKEMKLIKENPQSKTAQKSKRNPVVSKVTNFAKDKPSVKVTRKVADKMKDVDYDYDFTTVNYLITKNTHNEDEDSSDESNGSSEYKTFIRNARSPWTIGTYVDKLGEKTSALMSRILSFLPLFPQIPEHKKLSGANS